MAKTPHCGQLNVVYILIPTYYADQKNIFLTLLFHRFQDGRTTVQHWFTDQLEPQLDYYSQMTFQTTWQEYDILKKI